MALSRLFEQPAGVWFGPPFVYIKGRVLVNVKGASVKPLTASEMLQLALPQRDERAARAADEWYIKTFIAQVLRWLSQELGRDRPLAERFTSELARSLGLSHQSTEGFKFTRDLLEITADLIQRFSVVQRQRRTDQDDTLMPHEQERAGQEILTLMKTRPDFRVALRDDKPQKDRRGRPPRLSRLTRNRIIKLVNSGKASAAECARKYGISQATVSRLLAGVRSRPG